MQRVAIIGAGTMGAGIALCAAMADFEVDLVEIDAAIRHRACERLKRDAARAERTDALTRVQLCAAIDEIGAAELAIEAVPEVLELKQRVFLELERKLGDGAILATNTSSLSVRQIAEVLAAPQRALGLHFFNPPVVMKLIEVVQTDDADAAVIEIGRTFAQALGKTAVITADSPGFIVNRVARPYYVQALRALDAGVGDVRDLDFLARGTGFRMGPFELMDLIGLDVNLATTESIYERTEAARFEPVPRQQKMVAERKLGRKTGEGFYKYEPGERVTVSPVTAPSAPAPNADEAVLVLGFGEFADAVASTLRQTYENVHQIETDDALDQLDWQPTIVFDLGDGVSDRWARLAELERIVSEDTVIFVDAYSTPIRALADRLEKPQRIVGYGIIGSLERQAVVEIVDADQTDDDALALAEELFAALGKRTMLVADVPALFLGRVVASVVNEAVYAVQEGVASVDDIDRAMQLGTNYPAGPIAWGKEIGGERVFRILSQLAAAEGKAFGPARALWTLDANAEELEHAAEEQLREAERRYNLYSG